MGLKSAALLAFVATLLVAAYLTMHFVFAIASVARGLTPAVSLLSSFLYAFAGICVAVFFFVFQRRHD